MSNSGQRELNTVSSVLEYVKTQDVLPLLSDDPAAPRDRQVRVERIPGGVSNHVWRLDIGSATLILKQPLHRLAVQEEWISGTGRLDVEVAALRALSDWIPGSVPDVRFHDTTNKVCIMTAAPEGSRSWKQLMMSGSFRVETATAVGSTLRNIHHGSARSTDANRDQFGSLVYFQELRIDPFHRFVASRHPDLETPITHLVDDLIDNRSCFVHGDYSPKNILVHPDAGLTVIDLEVAHWGNPVFDVAYCLGHLMLKGWHLRRRSEALNSIRAYLNGYGSVPNRLINHLGLMLLARIDGKSTVEYLTDASVVRTVREAGRSMVTTDLHPSAPEDVTRIVAAVLQ